MGHLREQAISMWAATPHAISRLHLHNIAPEVARRHPDETWDSWLRRQSLRYDSPPATPRDGNAPTAPLRPPHMLAAQPTCCLRTYNLDSIAEGERHMRRSLLLAHASTLAV